jgi:tubulin-folding cofactor B
MQSNYTDVSLVEKYELPPEEYEARKDSVLAWKKAQKLGRFDPKAPSIEEQKVKALEREIEERGSSSCIACFLPNYQNNYHHSL